MVSERKEGGGVFDELRHADMEQDRSILDAPVAPRQPEQAVDIGALELGKLAVVHDDVDDGVFSPQLFQHLNVGGIACFRLFAAF